ncbi:MAG: cytochrome c class [Novosphingobium sp.]|nr:cytochrome c class [Novosphingobium sp.]
MPASLKFILGLLACAVALAFGAGVVEVRQGNNQARVTAEAITGGNSAPGKIAIQRFGCGGCHTIPGVAGANGTVGAPLADVAGRAELAGYLANTPPNMVRWLRDPQGVAPGNGMPNLGVGEREARDMAAYLYTLRRLPLNP